MKLIILKTEEGKTLKFIMERQVLHIHILMIKIGNGVILDLEDSKLSLKVKKIIECLMGVLLP